ncbi:hypothetical protein AAHZ94_35315, partial [Streptomyces sp. HSW2009]
PPCFARPPRSGPPAPAPRDARARRTRRAGHGATEGRTVDALRDHLADPQRAPRLAAELVAAWEGRERATQAPVGAPYPPAEVRAVLDGCA